MDISIFDLFKIGIGPSSSHTVGPMKAALKFLEQAQKNHDLSKINKINIKLYGSLALTGIGHASDTAILLGLMGEKPETINIKTSHNKIAIVKSDKKIFLLGKFEIDFDYHKDLELIPEMHDGHPNTMCFTLYSEQDEIFKQYYFSVGGGFIKEENQEHQEQTLATKYHFKSGEELLELSKKENLSIAEIIETNEKLRFSDAEIEQKISAIWQVMQESVTNGCHTEGILPGGLNVKRRAPSIYRKLQADDVEKDHRNIFDFVSLYALAVNEENAAGGRIVTAPTNGAAGIIPAILHYYDKYGDNDLDINMLKKFFFSAGAIGLLYKENASISGAEMGCQGEVGVACSMAAAGLAALNGANSKQIEAAAEIGMEHNLGLTCDPVKGLVQVPCIERNTMGAIKAINAARLALNGDGEQKVSLDKVIKTMFQIGNDMKSRYKETSTGGLAINVVEC